MGSGSIAKGETFRRERFVLTTLSYPCFYILFEIFYPYEKGQRIMTKEMYENFDNISLAALIMSCGFLLNNTYSH